MRKVKAKPPKKRTTQAIALGNYRATKRSKGLCVERNCASPAKQGSLRCIDHNYKRYLRDHLGELKICVVCKKVSRRNARYCAEHQEEGLTKERLARTIKTACQSYCPYCNIWGHTETACSKKKKDLEAQEGTPCYYVIRFLLPCLILVLFGLR